MSGRNHAIKQEQEERSAMEANGIGGPSDCLFAAGPRTCKTKQNKTRHQIPRYDQTNLVIVEDLEGVVQDCLDDADLPASVGDVASGVGAHQGWSGMRC